MSYSDRVGIRQAIVTRVEAAMTSGLSTVGVFYAQPGEAEPTEVVFFGDIEGSEEIDTLGGTSRGRTDEFTLETMIATAGHSDEQDADERCQEILGAVCESLFESTALPGFPRVGLYPGRLNGPYAFRPSPEQPVVSVAQLTITVRAPIRGA